MHFKNFLRTKYFKEFSKVSGITYDKLTRISTREVVFAFEKPDLPNVRNNKLHEILIDPQGNTISMTYITSHSKNTFQACCFNSTKEDFIRVMELILISFFNLHEKRNEYLKILIQSKIHFNHNVLKMIIKNENLNQKDLNQIFEHLKKKLNFTNLRFLLKHKNFDLKSLFKKILFTNKLNKQNFESVVCFDVIKKDKTLMCEFLKYEESILFDKIEEKMLYKDLLSYSKHSIIRSNQLSKDYLSIKETTIKKILMFLVKSEQITPMYRKKGTLGYRNLSELKDIPPEKIEVDFKRI